MLTVFIKKFSIIMFFALAAFPLMTPTINSIVIITTCLLVIYNLITTSKPIKFNKNLILLTLVFWMFFIYQFTASEFSFKIILLNLPFLVFPLIFYFRPEYIEKKIKDQSLTVFQISVVIASLYFLSVFLISNQTKSLFLVNNYNIPFFRDFVFNKASLKIHPTYIASFLLISYTISLFKFFKNTLSNNYIKTLHIFNMLFLCFMIVLFNSKIVFLVLLISNGVFLFFYFKRFLKCCRKNPLKSITFTIITIVIFGIFSSENLIIKRFIELKTELSSPIKGDYYNSTNIRVAILKCNLSLLKNVPVLGYGNALQNKLNGCFKANYNSDFYIKSTYNTHNYYINLILYGGWLFLFIFLIYIFTLFFSIKHTTLAIFIILQILVINLTENYLSRHYGIITFNYFLALFAFINHKDSALS